MTAKEYLSQAKSLDEAIHNRLQDLEYWRCMANSLSGTKHDGMPHSANRPTEANFTIYIETIDEIQHDLKEMTTQLIGIRKEIVSRLDMMDNHNERILLRYRYLDGLTWETIERMMNLSKSSVHRIHGSALKHFPMPC